MSRVHKPGKWMNENTYDSDVYNPSKMVRIHCEGEDYHKAKTLAHWLFVKYDMSYKAFTRKSKKKKDELRAEFSADTGVDLRNKHRKMKTYEFQVCFGDGRYATGTYCVDAFSEEEATDKALMEICNALYSALPDLGIDVTVDLYAEYEIEE